MRLAGLLGLLLLFSPSRVKAAGFTSQQYEDWEDWMFDMLRAEGQEQGLKPNQFVKYQLDICVDDVLQYVTFQVRADQNGVIQVSTTTQFTNDPCPPSVDDKGNPLPTHDAWNDPTETHGTYGPVGNAAQGSRPSGASVTKQAANGVFTVRPPFRDVPFLPLYAPAAFPPTPACDPANNANALLVNHLQDSVSRVNTCAGSNATVISTPHLPLEVAVTPDGLTAIVTCFQNAIAFIDLNSNQLVGTLQTSSSINPSGIAISSDGTKAYVTSFTAITPALLVVDIAQRKIIQQIPLDAYPQSVFLTPDNLLAYVTSPIQNEITVVDLTSATVNRTMAFIQPFTVAFNSTGATAYISNANGVSVLNTTTYQVTQNIAVGAQAVDVAVLPDDSLIVVGSYAGKSISVIDPKTLKAQTFPISGRPRGFSIIQ